MADLLILAGGLLGCAVVMALAGAGLIHVADWWADRRCRAGSCLDCAWFDSWISRPVPDWQEQERRVAEAIDWALWDVEMTRRP